MFHIFPLFSNPAAPVILEPGSPRTEKKGGRSQAPLTGLSHPGDAEAGEAEEHHSDERDEQVHVPGPHGADSMAAATSSLTRIAEHAATTPPAKDGHALGAASAAAQEN